MFIRFLPTYTKCLTFIIQIPSGRRSLFSLAGVVQHRVIFLFTFSIEMRMGESTCHW